MEDLLLNLAAALGLALVGALAYFGRQLTNTLIAYLNQKIGLENTNALRKAAGSAVRALEQSNVYNDLGGPEKKQYAMLWMQQEAEKIGVNVEVEDLDRFIEEAVQVMNTEYGKNAPPLPGPVTAPGIFKPPPDELKV